MRNKLAEPIGNYGNDAPTLLIGRQLGETGTEWMYDPKGAKNTKNLWIQRMRTARGPSGAFTSTCSPGLENVKLTRGLSIFYTTPTEYRGSYVAYRIPLYYSRTPTIRDGKKWTILFCYPRFSCTK